MLLRRIVSGLIALAVALAVAGIARAESMEELKTKAEQGNADAQVDLGLRYEDGRAVIRDYAEAVKWYRKAAEQGTANAMVHLGYMYAQGLGVTKDYDEAMKWWLKAAEQGNANGQSSLGIMYEYGKGVPQDYVQAHMWFDLAAGEGDRIASEFRDAVAAKMTPAQIAEAQRLAHEWKLRKEATQSGSATQKTNRDRKDPSEQEGIVP